MISDDSPDPRNGKIIQCRVLARTLWVPWAGSLAGPWCEAPCHYAAGLHHPHQYPIFGYPSTTRTRQIPHASIAASLFKPRVLSSLTGGPASSSPLSSSFSVLLFYTAALTTSLVCIAWIVVVRKYSDLFSLILYLCAFSTVPTLTMHPNTRVTRPRLLTLFKTE